MNPIPALVARVLPSGVLSRLDFQALLDQHGRMLKIETALPTLALIPEKLVMKEAVNAPFELVVDCVSTSAGFELKQLMGEQMSVGLLRADGSYKPWHGYVTTAAQLGSDGGTSRYRLEMQSWLSFLALRRDSFVFQDKTTREIVEDIFKDYPQANFHWELTTILRKRSLCTQFDETDLAFITRLLAEDGLSYRFDQLEDEAASDADKALQARHVLVIEDTSIVRPSLGDMRFTSVHATANLAGQNDAVTAFAAMRSVQANAVALGAWNYKSTDGVAATDETSLDIGDLPRLEVYDGSGGYRYADGDAAAQAAALALGELELGFKRFEGQGSGRIFTAGSTFALVDHPLYGADTTAAPYAGAPGATRERPDNEFCLVAVEHHATNNLGSNAASLLELTELESGTYVNHFYAVPAAAPVVPRIIRKPTAPTASTALIVGQSGESITTDRDHRVKVQFHWQRGERSNPGGLAHVSANDSRGNAPGSERSGTWVRVALPAAGANWGAAFTPRVGNEVAIGFVDGDIDRPLITGQLHNGADAPPFSAGADSGVNHPGVISGMHTERLDQGGFNQWAVDDASGQLRTRLLADHTAAELSLGYLIQQSGGSAHRGSWRGTGFEGSTSGWVGVHADKGLLISTAPRFGTYGSAESTQMDATESVDQLKAAQDLSNHLSAASKGSGAQGLAGLGTDHGFAKMLQAIELGAEAPAPAESPSATASGASPAGPESSAHAFGAPVVVLSTPHSAVLASDASITSFAGSDMSMVAGGDLHHTAGQIWSSVSGKTASWFTSQGGAKVYAANGAVSLRAHTDELQLWADKDVTVTSVNREITISAATKIEMIAGQSSVTLNGGDIEFKTLGAFTVKAASKAFLGGASGAADIPALPAGQVKVPAIGSAIPPRKNDLAFRRVYADGSPIPNLPYEVTLPDGSKRKGTTDSEGLAIHRDVPDGEASVVYGLDPNPPTASVRMEVDDDFARMTETPPISYE